MSLRVTQGAVRSALPGASVTALKRLKANAIGPRVAAAASRTASAARARVGLLLALLGLGVVLPPPTASADVFKYVDQDGNVFFSDAPLISAGTSTGLRLEWKRTATRLAASNRERSQALWRQQAEVDARLQARLSAETSAAEVGERGDGRPESLGDSMWMRRMRYQPLIEAAAHRHGLVPELLHAVIRAESAYRADAISHAGACGLMQLMPGTAERFRVTEIWDPAQNIEGGAAYLRFLLDLFDDDLRLALAGYNAGENAVKRYGHRIPPYAETEHYVRKVLQFLRAEPSRPS